MSGREMVAYHDLEWGVPVRDDRILFEYMALDAFQAGLSWSTILRKREAFRAAFSGFDPAAVAEYGDSDVIRLLSDRGIVRNRMKIETTVRNACAFLQIQAEHGSFSRYIWSFVGGEPVQNTWRREDEVPSRSPESEQLSRALMGCGFRFVGPVICYAFMQAAGLVNDHVVGCFRHREVA
ncbi:MAG: DNA-3-methyladenine glycosylase I, partial [Gemmatimonadota bacterium]